MHDCVNMKRYGWYGNIQFVSMNNIFPKHDIHGANTQVFLFHYYYFPTWGGGGGGRGGR